MKKTLLVASIAATAFTSGTALADRVHIRNLTDREIKFGLRCLHSDGPGQWQRAAIDSQEAKWYNVDNCQRYNIAIVTAHNDGDKDSVRYNLYAHEHYNIVYDRHKELFDVRRVRD